VNLLQMSIPFFYTLITHRQKPTSVAQIPHALV